jgi:hypothetical protein
MYVDYICIYDQTKKPKYAYLNVQDHLNDIGRWTIGSRKKINGNKCYAVPFSRINKIDVPRLTLGNVYTRAGVPLSGVHLQLRLNWTKHSEVVTTKTLRNLGKLIPQLQLSLLQRSKLPVYKTYV